MVISQILHFSWASHASRNIVLVFYACTYICLNRLPVVKFKIQRKQKLRTGTGKDTREKKDIMS